MLVVRLHVVTTILCLLAFISAATADPVCDALSYGNPRYNDCRDLVLTIDEGLDTHTSDYRSQRFFGLRGDKPPFWIPQRALGLKSILPIFGTRGQLKPPQS